jgi:hypothetical protein
MFTISQSIQSYINAMVEDIKAAAPNSSGELRNSIQADIVLTESSYEVNILMKDYGEYQDKGVNGTQVNWGSPYSFKKMPPTSSLDKWIVRKGIAPRSGSGQFLSRAGLKFAIARSIMIKGIRPKNFIEPNVDPKLEGLANLTAEEIWDNFAEEQNKKDNK